MVVLVPGRLLLNHVVSLAFAIGHLSILVVHLSVDHIVVVLTLLHLGLGSIRRGLQHLQVRSLLHVLGGLGVVVERTVDVARVQGHF